MFQPRRSWIVVMAAGLALTSIGCSPKPSHEAARESSGRNAGGLSDKSASIRRAERDGGVLQPKQQEPPQPATIPNVNLSDELRANCLVKVGDVLPRAELPDLAGKTRSLASLYGKKLTVVCLWTAASRRSQLEAADTLRSLTNDIAKPFSDKRVQVIGIEISPNDVDLAAWKSIRETVSKLPFPCLIDGKGQFLGRVCKDDKLPRVFLLDAEGKILWFDVEYSRSTREDLLQGIRVALGELK